MLCAPLLGPDTEGDPGPRCGHTLTSVPGENGRGQRLVVFGGATALESNGPNSSGGIRTRPAPTRPSFSPTPLSSLR